MRSLSLVRGAVVMMALFATTFVSLPSLSGKALFTASAPRVERATKGDRLPVASPVTEQGDSALQTQLPVRGKIPVGCDSSFSPISSPRLATVFGRCAV